MSRYARALLAFALAWSLAGPAHADDAAPVLKARDPRANEGIFELTFAPGGFAPSDTSASSSGGRLTSQFGMSMRLGGFSQLAPFFGMGIRLPMYFQTADYGSAQSAFTFLMGLDLILGVPVGPFLPYFGVGGGLTAGLYKPSSTADRAPDASYLWNWFVGARVFLLKALSFGFEALSMQSGMMQFSSKTKKGWSNGGLTVRVNDVVGMSYNFVLTYHWSAK